MCKARAVLIILLGLVSALWGCNQAHQSLGAGSAPDILSPSEELELGTETGNPQFEEPPPTTMDGETEQPPTRQSGIDDVIDKVCETAARCQPEISREDCRDALNKEPLQSEFLGALGVTDHDLEYVRAHMGTGDLTYDMFQLSDCLFAIEGQNCDDVAGEGFLAYLPLSCHQLFQSHPGIEHSPGVIEAPQEQTSPEVVPGAARDQISPDIPPVIIPVIIQKSK